MLLKCLGKSKLPQITPIDPKKTQVIVKRLNYEMVAGYLKEYPAGVFIENIDRKTAYWAKRRLEQLTKQLITSRPVLTTDKREGYEFKFQTENIK
jgi:hypothetical protein